MRNHRSLVMPRMFDGILDTFLSQSRKTARTETSS
jgi:hypothetical protein